MDLYELFFNPKGIYEGNWTIPFQLLKDNTKKYQNKIVKEWEQYQKEQLIKVLDWYPFQEIVNTIELIYISKLNEDKNKRVLKIDKTHIYCKILDSMGINNSSNFFIDDNKFVDETEIYPIFKEKLRSYKHQLYAVINKLKRIEDTEFYEPYQDYLEIGKYNLSPIEFATKVKEQLMIILPKVKYLDEFCDRELDIELLCNQIDNEELQLALAIYLTEYSRSIVKEVGLIHNSFITCINYYDQQHPNAKAKLGDNEYTTNDFISMYEKIRFENPDFVDKRIEIDPDAEISLEYMEQLRQDFVKQLELQSLIVNWEILPKGEVIRTNEVNNTLRSNTERSLKEQHIMHIKQQLDHSDPIMVINGINDFTGYIGYIYPNGTIIFEKFFEYYLESSNYKISVDNATYVMDIKNFTELSKLSKIDLIRMIKNKEVQATRILHDHKTGLKNWTKKLEIVTSAGTPIIKREDLEVLVPQNKKYTIHSEY